MPVSFRELYNAFELLPLGQYQAFLCRQTGKIYRHSDDSDFAKLEEELPDDIEDSEKYIAIPDKRDLDLGKVLVLDFAREYLSDDYEEVERIFRKRGAYQKFKALLVHKHALDAWYEFEAKATERALRDWCELHSVDVKD